jgi:glycosyltransferase involved in cell wall biosynthesis
MPTPKNKPFIVHCQPTLDGSYGGPARTVPALCSAIASNGLRTSLISANSKSPVTNPELAKNEGYDLYWSKSESGSSFLDILENSLGHQKPDILHVHGLWRSYHISSVRWAKHNKIPIIISPRGMLQPWALNDKKLKKKLAMSLYQNKLLEHASMFHAASIEEAKSIRSLGFKQPIIVLANGVNFPKSPLLTHPKEKNIRTLLFLSRLHPSKGLIHLVEAWSRLNRGGWRLVIAGPGEATFVKKLATLSKNLGLIWRKVDALDDCSCNDPDVIYWVGALDDTQKWEMYSNSDAFVLPTFSENFGVSIAEAMAAALPVVTTYGAPWQLLQETRSGWWIPIGLKPLEVALQEIMCLKSEELMNMGKRGQKESYSRFSWDLIGQQMVQSYKWYLGKDSKPDCILLD